MFTKDGIDVSLDELTKENYLCPAGEEMSYHVVIETKQFDPKTGKRISTPRLQKFGKKMWESVIYSALRKQGWDIKIVHNAAEWFKENQARLAEAQAQRVENEKAAKAAELAALKAQMKKELLAELKAEEKASKSQKKAKSEAAEKE